MTPMATTLGTLGITDKSSPVSLVPSASIKKEDHDIDSCDKHDPASCWQYAEDINQYHLEAEVCKGYCERNNLQLLTLYCF